MEPRASCFQGRYKTAGLEKNIFGKSAAGIEPAAFLGQPVHLQLPGPLRAFGWLIGARSPTDKLYNWLDARGRREQHEWGTNLYRVSMSELWPRRGEISKCFFSTEIHNSNPAVSRLNPAVSPFKSGCPDSLLPKILPPLSSPKIPTASSFSRKEEKQPREKIGFLAIYAAGLIKAEDSLKDGDLAEDLKSFAARYGIRYFDAKPGRDSPIQEAITIARAIIARERASQKKMPARSVALSNAKRERAC
jgi:hypothetical protein